MRPGAVNHDSRQGAYRADFNRAHAHHHQRDPVPGEQVEVGQQDRELVREKKLTEISDLRDESDRKGMRVVIELKQACIPQVVLNKLYKHTQLQQASA